MDCILHTGYKQPDGYGQKKYKARVVLAHRLAYAQAHGLDVFSMQGGVMHSCDNPSCVNPEHLSLGSIAQNVADMHAKGRHSHKLSAEDKQYILSNVRKGKRGPGGHKGNIPELAERFGCCVDSIRAVVRSGA